MKTPNEMTAEECADWCANDDGWYPLAPCRILWVHGTPEDHDVTGEHPYPLTLDGAASAMPEGWSWWVNFTQLDVPFIAAAIEWVTVHGEIEVRATDEITARYRLAVSCRMALKESKP